MCEENPSKSRGVEASDDDTIVVVALTGTLADSSQIEDQTQPTPLQLPTLAPQTTQTPTSTKIYIPKRKARKQQIPDPTPPKKTTAMGNAVKKDRCTPCHNSRKGCRLEEGAIECTECAKRGKHCDARRVIISDDEDDNDDDTDIAVPESPEILMTDYNVRVPTAPRPRNPATIAEVVAEDERLERVRVQAAAEDAEAEVEAMLEEAGLNDVTDSTWEQSWEPATLPSGAINPWATPSNLPSGAANPWATPTASPFDTAKFFSNTFASLEPKKKAARPTKNNKAAEPESKPTYPLQVPILCCSKARAVTPITDDIKGDLENFGKLVGGTYPTDIQTQPNRPYGVIWTDHNTLIGVLKVERATGKKDCNWYGVTGRVPTEIIHAIPIVVDLKESLTIHKECFVRLTSGVDFKCRDHPECVWTMFQVRWQAQGEAKRRMVIMKIAEATGKDFEELVAADRAKRMHL